VTFGEVPIGHIFRWDSGCDCICRRLDERQYVYVARCEKHGPSLGKYDMLADGPVVYDAFTAMLEARQWEQF